MLVPLVDCCVHEISLGLYKYDLQYLFISI